MNSREGACEDGQRLQLLLPWTNHTLDTSTNSRRHLLYAQTYTKLLIILHLTFEPQARIPNNQHKTIYCDEEIINNREFYKSVYKIIESQV